LKVAVGSENPVKLQAVKEVFRNVFGEVEIVSVKVDSDVPSQPFGKETFKGALNRARKALYFADADFGVGIEGGVIRLYGRWYNLGFVTIVNREGKIGTGTSGWFECPFNILNELRRGKELGQVISEISGKPEIQRREGAIGVFTKGKIKRKDLYKHGVFMALVKFISPEIFQT